MEHQDIFQDYQLLFTTLFESTQQGNILIQNDLQVKLFNTQAREMFAQVITTGLRTACNFLELVPDTILDKVLQLIRKAQNTHETAKEAIEISALTGEKVYYEFCITPVKPTFGGQIAYLSLGIIDLTQMRQREREVFHKNEMLASLLDSNSTYLIRTDMEGKYTYVNDAFCKKFGLTEAQVLGKYYAPTVHPDDIVECEKAAYAAISEPGKVVTFEIRKPNPVGGYFHTEWEFVTIADSAGQIVEIQGVGRDISSYKQTQKQLEEERKQLELTIWSGRLGTWDWDVPTGVVKINDYWAEMLGYERHEIANDLAAWEARVHPPTTCLLHSKPSTNIWQVTRFTTSRSTA